MRSRFAAVLVCLFVAGASAPPAGAQDSVPGTGGSPTSPRPDTGAATPVDPAQPRTAARDQPQQTTTGRISGRVVGGEAGLPLRRAVVRVHGEALQEGRVTTTDENGRYEFSDLPAGRMVLFASKGGYVMTPYGQRHPNEGPRPVEVAEGQRVDGINFNLQKGAVISGRVTDEFGEPAAGLGINVLTYRYVEGRRQLAPAGWHMSQTDDLGRFRLFGLPPGEYYVKASGESEGMFMGVRSDNRSGFADTYFPGTPSIAEAQRIRVGAGQELTSVNFALQPSRLMRITGEVLDSQGQPVSRGYIVVQEGSKGSMFFNTKNGGMIGPDGRFTLSGVSPGDYVLHVGMHIEGTEGESAAFPVTVGAEDIEGITIVTSPGARISGQVMFETAPPDTVRPADLSLYATAIEPISPMQGRGVTVKDDWTFETRAHEGPLLIRVMTLLDGWVLKAVLHHGAEVTDTGIDIKSGASIDGVQIVLSNRVSTVTGAVVDPQGRPVRDYAVVVFAADPERWGPSSRYLFAARPTQQGRFEITKLPAGQYLAAAVPYLEEGQQTDPEFLAELRHHAVPFDLSDGERKVLTLNLLKR